MQRFTYQARDLQGRKLSGKVEAKSREAAAAILREKQLLIVSLHEQSEGTLDEVLALFAKVKTDDIVTFTRQLATMINAGLPLLKAFAILEGQSKPAMRKVVRQLTRSIEGGANFGDSLTKQKEVFSPIYVSLVQAGEAAGALDTTLVRLADSLEKQKEFRAKTKGALVYPAIVLVAMVVVMIIMMVFVVPQMTELYVDFGADLPFATQLLIDMSNFFQNQWYILAGAVVAFVFVFRRWVKTTSGRWQWDKFLLRLPIFGKLRQQTILAEFTRTLSLMLGAGISLLEALEIITVGVDSVVFQKSLTDARSDVEKGKTLSNSLLHQGVFPDLLPQMVAVGEETGRMDDVLAKLAAYYEQESEQAIKVMTTALEPMIMVVLGVGVGFLLVAIVMPIYNLTSQF